MKTDKSMWLFFALLSALFAALTAILSKTGIERVNSNLATAIRCIVIQLMSWGIVFATGHGGDLSSVSNRSCVFPVLSALATWAFWLCCFKALQPDEVSNLAAVDKLSTILTVTPALIIFHESFTLKTAPGMLCITFGTLLMTHFREETSLWLF